MLDWIKNLLNRLRGGKSKRTPQEIARAHKKNISYNAQENFSSANEEKNFSAPVYENVPQENFPENAINVKNDSDFENLKQKLFNLNQFEEFTNNSQFKWVKVRIDRIRSELERMKTPANFDDEELNFKLAKKIKEIAVHVLDILDNCNSATSIADYERQKLRSLSESYLNSLGIEEKNFSVGDLYSDWADLGMSDSPLIVSIGNRNLHNKIKSVSIQPRIIYYVNENHELDKMIFGGKCTAYKFKEG